MEYPGMTMGLRSRVCQIIHAHPGITLSRMDALIYGSGSGRRQIERICRDLHGEGLVCRRGQGGRHNPYTYAWIRGEQDAYGPGLNPA
jgi:hypothetical protein